MLEVDRGTFAIRSAKEELPYRRRSREFLQTRTILRTKSCCQRTISITTSNGMSRIKSSRSSLQQVRKLRVDQTRPTNKQRRCGTDLKSASLTKSGRRTGGAVSVCFRRRLNGHRKCHIALSLRVSSPSGANKQDDAWNRDPSEGYVTASTSSQVSTDSPSSALSVWQLNFGGQLLAVDFSWSCYYYSLC